MREVVLDTETTGFSPDRGHRIVEIGAVELLDRVPTGRVYQQYINPQRDMPWGAYKVHGLSERFLRNKPVFGEIGREFIEFIGNDTLIIHNAGFDIKFLNAEFRWIGLPQISSDRVVDTLVIARSRFPGENCSLDNVCLRLGVDVSARSDRHGAVIDSKILAEMYLELTAPLVEEKIQPASKAEHSGGRNQQVKKSGFDSTSFSNQPRTESTVRHSKQNQLDAFFGQSVESIPDQGIIQHPQNSQRNMTVNRECNLYLIDGSSFSFRAFHALPPLTRASDGLQVGAVSGFVNMLWKMVQDNKGSDAPTHVAVIFDKGSYTFRNEIYPKYKANREEMPEELRPQMPLTRDATRAFGIACVEKEGFEADDIIATLARQVTEVGGRVTINANDKGLMQLVGNGVEMFDAMKNRRIGVDEVREIIGVGPDRVNDVQALVGNNVDNVPGAPGIGLKTAVRLINEYGDLESLLERAEEIKQPKRRESLIDNRELIRISKRLVRLDSEVELEFGLDDLEAKDIDPKTLLEFLRKMEFRMITRRVADTLGVEVPAIGEAMPDERARSRQNVAPDKKRPFDPKAYEEPVLLE